MRRFAAALIAIAEILARSLAMGRTRLASVAKQRGRAKSGNSRFF
jgi:hypothetical protein